MKKILIPIKNRIFSTEKEFLEKKSRQGLRLEKKSLFYYHFKSIEAKDVTYVIDLLPAHTNKKDLITLTDWNPIISQKTIYKKMVKIYYLSEKKDSRLLVDNKAILNYYKYLHQLFLLLFLSLLSPSLLFFVLATAQIFLPAFLMYTSILLLIPSTYFLVCHIVYDKAISYISTTLGILTGNEAKYTIYLKKVTPQQTEQIENALSEFGYFKKINTHYYQGKSPLDKEELLNELSSMVKTGPNNIQIISPGDFYLFL